jgi:predicted O-methyltransferase YrrM
MAESTTNADAHQIPARSTLGRVDADARPRRPHQLAPDKGTVEFEPVAIVGMALLLPGGVFTLSEFWSMLINKEDGRCEIPASRYNIDGFHHPTEPHSIKPRHGYFLEEDPALFDAGFFNITTLEAERMDPQQRLLLEVAWECLESTGEGDWRGKRIGCYVGVFGGDWLEVACKDTEVIDRYRAVGTGAWTQFLPALGHGNPRLRVLEIGAGTGSATVDMLDLLRTPEGARLYSQYDFTDISPGFIAAAREEFPHPGIDLKVLDISKDPEEQGFTPHAYDLVIAGKVLPATPKLGDTLRHVRKLLAPGGWLLLQELTTPGKLAWPLVTTL